MSSRDGSQGAKALPGSRGWFFTAGDRKELRLVLLSDCPRETVWELGWNWRVLEQHHPWVTSTGCGAVELLGRCSQGPGVAEGINRAWLWR